MKDEIVVWMFSTRVVTTQLGYALVNELCEFAHGAFRPDKYSRYEPIKTIFDATNLKESVAGLVDSQGAFLYTTGKPIRLLGMVWNRYYPPDMMLQDHLGRLQPCLPPPLFCTDLVFNVAGAWASKIGLPTITNFASRMFEICDADFGFVTTREDLTAKNYINRVQREGTDPSAGVPGLYWQNFFSRRYAQWLRLGELPAWLAKTQDLTNGSVLVQFGNNLVGCRNPEILATQRLAISFLGENRFFDIDFPNRNLESPDWIKL